MNDDRCMCCRVIGPTQQQRDRDLEEASKAAFERMLPGLLAELKRVS